MNFISVADNCYQTYSFYQFYLTSNVVGFQLLQPLTLLTLNLSIF